METWKKIEGYAKYSVSDKGRVRNDKTGKILSPGPDSNKYYFVILCEDGHKKHGYLHRLVAQSFIPNPNNLPEVNHKDGNKRNCTKDNLEWATHSDNIQHSMKVLGQTRKPGKVEPIVCVETGVIFSNVEAAAKAIGRSSMAIRKCLYGWTKTAAGLHWRYLHDCENGSDSRGESYDLWVCKSRWEEYFGVPEEQSVG